ncbi:MAG TPA: universal stress protein [Gallionella sp.]|nr:universal stress protein [Gallionella sp.]
MKCYQNILCATDFSVHCKAAAERAIEMARLCGAKLTLLHVVEYFPEDRSNEVIAPEDNEPATYRKQQAHTLLANFAEDLGCAEACREVSFSTRSARHGIIRYAEEQSIDLIVVATHGRHGIANILGATAYGVVHRARCDVLAVRAKAD